MCTGDIYVLGPYFIMCQCSLTPRPSRVISVACNNFEMNMGRCGYEPIALMGRLACTSGAYNSHTYIIIQCTAWYSIIFSLVINYIEIPLAVMMNMVNTITAWGLSSLIIFTSPFPACLFMNIITLNTCTETSLIFICTATKVLIGSSSI